jgi:hypothetical protein
MPKVNIDDFVLDNQRLIFAIGRVYDYDKLLALSDADFADFYLQTMDRYRTLDGWWNPNKVPKCFECHAVIPGPDQLRRYAGASLHAGDCFKAWYLKNRDEGESPIIRKYWERVMAIPLSSVDAASVK